VPTVPLPHDPNLEQLRKQAKDLRRALRAGASDAITEAAEHHPDLVIDGPVPLSAAQLVVARRYGFTSWPRLVHHLDVVEHYTRAPGRVEAGADPAYEFLRLACLTYADDEPSRREQAARLLAHQPLIADAGVHVAAACADADRVRAHLRRDATLARTLGGPFAWEPLMYLAYARHDPEVALEAVLDTTRVLIGAGADPNAGYLWLGLPTPFTVLTGVFGEGEQGPIDQPRHPHAAQLARFLLEAGAEANDGQTLYNRMFGPDDDHLELLFEFGLGRGAGGPWRARLGDAIDSPEDLVRSQLEWAVTHDMVTRVRLLAEHGTDFVSPFPDGNTPCAAAMSSGSRATADLLVELGASRPELGIVDAFVATALAGDRSGIDRILAGAADVDVDVVEQVRSRRPALIVWAAATHHTEAVRLLAELGFDVDALGRSDVPAEQPWETALHVAAGDGDLELARLLLSLGADPSIRDMRFDSTPLGWARFHDHPALAALLEPVTPGESTAT
jgi:ankyrin repeat protein